MDDPILLHLPREIIGLIIKLDRSVYNCIVRLNKRLNQIGEVEALRYYSESPISVSELYRYIINYFGQSPRGSVTLHRPMKSSDLNCFDPELSIGPAYNHYISDYLVLENGLEVDIRSIDQWLSLFVNKSSYLGPFNNLKITILRYLEEGYTTRDVSIIFSILSNRLSCLKINYYFVIGETLDRYHDIVEGLFKIEDESIRKSSVTRYLESTRRSLQRELNHLEEEDTPVIPEIPVGFSENLESVAEQIEKEIEEVYLYLMDRDP